MSPRQGGFAGRDPGEGAEGRQRPRNGFLIVALALALVAVALLSAPVLADDTSPPTLGNATAVNATQFEFTVTDDGGVDESSISASDFTVDPGSIRDLNVTESGNDTVVTVRLHQRTRQNNVALSMTNGGSISDDAGNNLTDAELTVTGMDSYDPYLQEYGLERLSEERVQIEFYVDERVHNTSVVVSGPESETLGPEDFTETDTPRDDEWRYHANYTFTTEGEYEITLEWVKDDNENFGIYYADRSVVYDVTRPQARISGPASASLGQTMIFDASRSSDEHGIASYEWAVDSNVTDTNQTLAYAFNESGRHEISLTVADGRNNTDTAVTTVEVLDVTTTRDVTITPGNDSGVDVTVGPNRSKRRVLVERSGHLVSNGSVALDSLTLSVPTNDTANLSAMALEEVPADFTVADQIGVGAFDVTHDGATVSDVTFRYTVERAPLDNASVPPDGMSLYRERGGDWNRLPALRVGGNDTHLEYRATAPGLSRFVVAGSNATDASEASDADGDGDASTGNETSVDGNASQVAQSSSARPAFAVVDAELLTRNVSAGNPVVAQATIANDGNATGTYRAALAINDSVVGTSEVTVPAGEQRDVTVAVSVESGGPASLNGTQLGTVSIGGGAVSNDGGGGGGLSIPNPLALWPGGLFGRALGAIFWLVVVVYAILKSLAIYLGY